MPSKTLSTNTYNELTELGLRKTDIAMPPLDYNIDAPEQQVSNVQENTEQQPWGDFINFGTVPDELPKEVLETMEEQSKVEQEVQEEPAKPIDNNQTVYKEEKPNKSIDNNLRLLREEKERIQKENERIQRENAEIMKMLQMQMMQQQESMKKPAPVYEEPDDFDTHLEDDSLAEIKDLRKVSKKVREVEKQNRETQKKLLEQQQAYSEMLLELQLKSKYPDISEVFTYDNAVKLRETDPDLAEIINSHTDPYKKTVAAYNAIKRYGIYKDPKIQKNTNKVVENISRPRPASSISPHQGKTPMSMANDYAEGRLTDSMKEQYLQEMLKYSKR